MGLPEMLELQASYEEAVSELRGLEVERDTLLFQVDVLQDSLEGVEELLAEAQREAGQANAELEREREARRKLEDMVSALMKEVERLKEEKNDTPTIKRSPTDEVNLPATLNALKLKLPPAGLVEESMEKLRKFVSMSPVRVPSLSLDRPACEEGVLQRPCENGVDDEKTDSDSVSAYEDAHADTPDNDAAELPHDSDDTKQQQPDACVVS
ncbi:hypothetical protein WMY93_011253 [Mugilogobius chulae]|uniref:Uncharacterized protein n=1 Tax=Mugilogobius chulae TaxID=88201 RepID=A0AAW0P1G3_9GOBI